MENAARPTRYRQASEQAQEMLALGESGRFEFKRDADAVTPKVLAALANWVALDVSRGVAHLLIGVDEIEDYDTGLVKGVVRGLPKGLDKSVSRLQDMGSRVRPIPVDLFIVEEAIDSDSPFIRVEVTPSMPPHYDDEGRRQTRQGRSTRPLADDELLRIYLDRESGAFAARFRQTANDLRSAVGGVRQQVDQIAESIEKTIAEPLRELVETSEYAASAAGSAESSAMMLSSDVDDVGRLVRDVQAVVGDLQDNSAETLAAKVFHARRKVWWNFTVDTWERTSIQAGRLLAKIEGLLSSDISIDPAHNAWELQIWVELLGERAKSQKGTLKWWAERCLLIEQYFSDPSYSGPLLPNLRAELHEDFDRAIDDPHSIVNQFKKTL